MKQIIKGLLLLWLLPLWGMAFADTAINIDSDFTKQQDLRPWLSTWQGEQRSLEQLVEEHYFFSLWQAVSDKGTPPSWQPVQLKMYLENTSDKTQHLLLVVDEPFMDYFELIQADQRGVIRHDIAGNHYPFSQRPIASYNLLYPIEIDPGERLNLLIEVQGRMDRLASKVSLWERDHYFERTDNILVTQAMYCGLLLLFAVYTFLLFIAVRESCYFWFSLFTSALLIRMMVQYNFFFEYFWPQWPALQNIVSISALLIGSLSLALFTCSYLNVKQHSRRLFQLYWLYALLHLPLGLFIAWQGWKVQYLVVWLVPAWIFSFVILATAWWVYRQGKKEALWFFMGYGAMLGLSFISILNHIFSLNLLWIVDGELGDLILLGTVSVVLSVRIGERQAQAHLHYAQSKAKNEFLAKMSHEIRTPINGVIGMAQLLVETPLSRTQKHYADVINHCGKTLLNVINDILEYSKIEAGKLELEQQAFRLDELLQRNNEIFWPQIQAKNLEYRFHFDASMPWHVIGDVSRIQQMLNNIFSNAVKFTETGSITLTAKVLDTGDDELRVEFAICDTGIGMTQIEQQRIFVPFAQANNATSRIYGGSGLGLNITRQLIEVMHGELHVQSTAGEGSCFTLRLPLQRDKTAEQAWLQSLKTIRTKQLMMISMQTAEKNTLYRVLSHWQAQPYYFNDDGEALNYLEQTISPVDAMLISKELVLQMSAIDKLQWQPYLSRMIIYDDCFTPDTQRILAFDAEQSLLMPYSLLELQQVLLRVFGISDESLTKAPNSIEPTESCTNLRVLVAEDDATNRLVIRAILKKLDIEHDIVANGKMAVDKYCENPQAFDLILMDYEMPIMDGCQAALEIRTFENKRDLLPIPIVAITAHVLPEYEKRCYESGMNLVLAKPIDVVELNATLKRFCAAC